MITTQSGPCGFFIIYEAAIRMRFVWRAYGKSYLCFVNP